MSPHLTVALPDESMRDRLQPAPDGVDYVVWDVAHEPLGRRIDLLVLRYMLPAAQLSRLAGQDIGIAQAQTLGFDGVAAALPAGIAFCNAVDVHEASTAELVLALLLAAQRGIPEAVLAQQRGQWEHAAHPGLAGSTVLVLGVGGVGREIAARLAPFDVTLLRAATSARSDELGAVIGPEGLRDALGAADAVVLAVPLGPATTGLVDAGFLDAMKVGALLVNVSRGSVVDTAALLERLAAGRVRAALDVTDPEPLPDGHPLWSAPGLLITPHVGGHTDAMVWRMDRVVREQVRRLVAGEEPANRVL